MNATPLAAPAGLVLATRADGDKRVEVTLTQGGTCHGWLGWFQMRLLDEWLSTAGEPDSTHWGPVFMPVENPLSVRAGEPVGFALKRRRARGVDVDHRARRAATTPEHFPFTAPHACENA